MADETIRKTAGPPQIVTPPPSSGILHGIRGSLDPITPADNRWLLGLTWVPSTCGLSWGTFVPCPIDEAGNPVTGQVLLSTGAVIPEPEEYQPFQIELESSCDAGTDWEDLRARAITEIESITEWALSSEFWHGTRRPTNFALVQAEPTLARLDDLGQYVTGGVLNPTATDSQSVEATPISPEASLDLLVDALAHCGGATRGTIHASYGLASRWMATGRVKANGPRLFTAVGGHLVIAHYATPHGPLDREDRDPGSDGFWAYGTGPVELRLDPVPDVIADPPPRQAASGFPGRPVGGLHTRTNRLSYRAVRNAAITTDPCCVFAVRVTPLA